MAEKPIYVRIGTWRPEEYSLNYAKGDVEVGVSVFEAEPAGNRLRILLDDEHDPDGRQADTLSGLLARIVEQRRRRDYMDQDPIFVVSGDYVGVGHDGEPLLKKLKVVSEIGPEDLLAPEIGFD